MSYVIFVIMTLVLAAAALAQPPGFHQFYGSLKYSNGTDVPDGTVVTASISGVNYTTTSSGGQYGYAPIFVVEGQQEMPIEFFVSSTKQAEQAYEESAITQLNFTLPCQSAGCDFLVNDCNNGSVRPSGELGLCSVNTETCADGVWSANGEYVALADDVMCDGLDEDCDGVADEDYVNAPTYCGVGMCSAEGTASCVDGKVVDSCAAGIPDAEIYDGEDNNCDGQVDEGWFADLQPTEITYYNYEEPIKPGMRVYFDTGIKNVGNAGTSGGFNIKWFADGELVGHGSHISVKAEETITEDNSLYVWDSASEGTHTFTFVVDSENHIAESNEDNNEISVTVTIASGTGIGPANQPS